MSGTLYSFDVFDTALTRTFARPIDLFCRLGRPGSSSPEEWMRMRVEAEREAHRRSRRDEVTMEEIYRLIAPAMKWSPEQMQQAIAAECELERVSVRPVPSILDQVSKLHDEQRSVLFISDAYLPAALLREMLSRHGFWKDGDRLYVSSDHGVTKLAGGLYRVVLDAERIPPRELCHTGDHDVADGISARRAGLETRSFTAARLNRYEKAVAERDELNWEFRSRLAAASRLARLARRCGAGTDEDTLWNVGASVIGPMLVGYVAWLLREAQGAGLKRLYFVSRDGQVLRRIAEALAAAWRIDVECRYLFGSRQAWHLPSLTDVGDRELGWIFDRTLFLSVDSVFRRVGLRADDVKTALDENGFADVPRHRNLDPAERSRLRALFRREPIRSRILAEAEARRREAGGYLRQEGLLDSTDWALVDMGWSGRMQHSLRSLLGRLGSNRPLTGFYFALNGACIAADGDRLLSYLDPDDFAADSMRYVPVLETITAADHGSVTGYRQEAGGRFMPTNTRRPLEEKNDRWVRVQQDGAVAFAQEFGRLIPLSDVPEADARHVCELLMRLFFGSPTRDEARAYGRFRSGEDQAGARLSRLAPRIPARMFWAAVLRGGRPLYRLRWPEACIAGSLSCARLRIALLHARQALGAWKKRILRSTGPQ